KNISRVIIAGIGEVEPKNPEKTLREIGAEILTCLNSNKIGEATIVVEGAIFGFAAANAASELAYGGRLKSYSFLKYFTKKKEEDKPSMKVLNVALKENTQAKAKFEKLKAIADAIFVARDYVSEPPNVIYPESYADAIKEDFKKLPIKVEILDEKDMKKLGMNALLGVGQGSRKESRLVIMTYNGSADKKSRPVCFVGKGVTFDTGGISIKPSEGMWDMKYDMGGSAAVVGAIRALAGRKAKVNAIGVIGLVENMPDGNAQRPSDVVVSMSGQTIEVLNTDAEGRLVLADALWYTQSKFNPKIMIDLATLTGAVGIALGQHKAGLMSNDDKLSEQISKAGEAVGEAVWRLPLGDEYQKQIDSKTADVQNISNTKGGGTITAGCFLERFVNKKTWAHLDIASVAWADKDKGLSPAGATGFGVQLLDRLVEDNYED
ncbi:MAG TPA: leucyl aminopeptidase, partial [Alphaproteobacteria bacterium]|nr:leucyl aminopeptidase [Alphaproteobacteria bacterium]